VGPERHVSQAQTFLLKPRNLPERQSAAPQTMICRPTFSARTSNGSYYRSWGTKFEVRIARLNPILISRVDGGPVALGKPDQMTETKLGHIGRRTTRALIPPPNSQI